MLHQYNAQRFRVSPSGHHVGTIPIGTIAYIQDTHRPFHGPGDRPIRCNPWMVTAWLNRNCLGSILAGGHLAVVRSLRDGRTKSVADWILLQCLDNDLTKG